MRLKALAAALKSLQSCLALYDPIDGSPPGSSVPEILQARILQWVAISFSNACMHAKSLQLCPTLCDPVDCTLLGFSVHGILQARILQWAAISFCRGSSQALNLYLLHCTQILYHLSHQGSPIKTSLSLILMHSKGWARPVDSLQSILPKSR